MFVDAAAPRAGQGGTQGGGNGGWQQRGQGLADGFPARQLAQPFARRIDIQQNEVRLGFRNGVGGNGVGGETRVGRRAGVRRAQHSHTRIHVAEYATEQFRLAALLFRWLGCAPESGRLPGLSGVSGVSGVSGLSGLSGVLCLTYRFRSLGPLRQLDAICLFGLVFPISV